MNVQVLKGITLTIMVGMFLVSTIQPAFSAEIILFQRNYQKGQERGQKAKGPEAFVVPPFVEKLRVILHTQEGDSFSGATVAINGSIVNLSDVGEAELSLGAGRMQAMTDRARAAREGKKIPVPLDRKTVEVSIHGRDGSGAKLMVVGVFDPARLPGFSSRQQ